MKAFALVKQQYWFALIAGNTYQNLKPNVKMNRQEQIAAAYKECPEYVKEHINDEGWIPHRYFLDLKCFYNGDEIDKINRELIRPKILRT